MKKLRKVTQSRWNNRTKPADSCNRIGDLGNRERGKERQASCGDKAALWQGGDVLPHPYLPPVEGGKQKENIFAISVSKSSIFFAYANKRPFLSAPNSKLFYTLFYISLWILAECPQNHHLFSAVTRIVFRNEHFFSPQGAVLLSACRRILVLISIKILPKGRILPCFFPHIYLVATGKSLLPEKQKESRTARWLTRTASSCARDFPTACICQAKAVSC